MELLKNAKRIICVLPKGKGIWLEKRLRDEMGLTAVNIHSGRGRSTSVSESISYGQYAEVEILSVVAQGEKADEIFEYIFFEAEINKPHGGFIYLVPLSQATSFSLPDLPEEDED